MFFLAARFHHAQPSGMREAVSPGTDSNAPRASTLRRAPPPWPWGGPGVPLAYTQQDPGIVIGLVMLVLVLVGGGWIEFNAV